MGKLRACSGVPKLRELIATACEDLSAVRGKGNGQNLFRMAGKRRKELASIGRPPNPRGSIPTGGDYLFAIRRESHRSDPARVRFELKEHPLGGCLENPANAVAATG